MQYFITFELIPLKKQIDAILELIQVTSIAISWKN